MVSAPPAPRPGRRGGGAHETSREPSAIGSASRRHCRRLAVAVQCRPRRPDAAGRRRGGREQPAGSAGAAPRPAPVATTARRAGCQPAQRHPPPTAAAFEAARSRCSTTPAASATTRPSWPAASTSRTTRRSSRSRPIATLGADPAKLKAQRDAAAGRRASRTSRSTRWSRSSRRSSTRADALRASPIRAGSPRGA